MHIRICIAQIDSLFSLINVNSICILLNRSTGQFESNLMAYHPLVAHIDTSSSSRAMIAAETITTTAWLSSNYIKPNHSTKLMTQDVN